MHPPQRAFCFISFPSLFLLGKRVLPSSGLGHKYVYVLSVIKLQVHWKGLRRVAA